MSSFLTNPFLTNAWQRIADQHVNDPASAIKSGHQDRTSWLLTHFPDHLDFVATRGQAQSVERGIRVFGRDDSKKLAFIGDMQRIKA